MTTVADLQARLELEYFDPITERSPSVPIVGAVSTSATEVTILDGVLSPDEEAMLGPGSEMELNDELLYVENYDASTRTLTVRRQHRGSPLRSHADGDFMRFPIRWPRWVQRQAIRDALDALCPPLFVVKEIRLNTDSLGYADLPLNTLTIVEVLAHVYGRWERVNADLFQTDPYDDERGMMQVEVGVPNTWARVRYGVDVTVPASDTDDISDLPSKWHRVVLIDAALALMSGVDIDAVDQEYLTESLRLDRFPVRSGENIVRSLITLREYHMNRFIEELKVTDPPRMEIADVVVFD